MSTTYRIEQWTREGQIMRAEYVDEYGTPYTLRRAIEDVDAVHGTDASEFSIRPLQWRIVDNATDEPVDEAYARKPWWLREDAEASSTDEAGRMLEELGRALRAGTDLPMPGLRVRVSLQPAWYGYGDSEAPRAQARREHVDVLAGLTGLEARERPTSGLYSTEPGGINIYAYVPPLDAEPVDEPEPVDAEAVARAVLQPDSLPDVEPPAEAGETEDALGVPGLTETEADDFMAGGAR